MTPPSRSADSAQRWDDKYRRGEHSGSEPAATVVESSRFWESCPNRRALDLACGAGRNAIYLAAKGWDVTAVDFSSEALDRTRALAAERGVDVQTAHEDIEAPGWGPTEAAYGLILATQFLHRPLFPGIRNAVAPGGLVVYETYTIDQLQLSGGPRKPQYLLEPNELLEEFRDWRVLRYEEDWEGRATASLIARKPALQHGSKP